MRLNHWLLIKELKKSSTCETAIERGATTVYNVFIYIYNHTMLIYIIYYSHSNTIVSVLEHKFTIGKHLPINCFT